jgi:unsaturated rhamnogalacturonyl hydrolase
MRRWPLGSYGNSPVSWNYQLSFLLDGVEAVGKSTGDPAALDYIRKTVDGLIGTDGSIPTYDPSSASMDDIALGRQALLLYEKTGETKYKIAVIRIRRQLATQPRNASGGFWHMNRFPNQMLLDDEFMFAPFLAEYASQFHEPKDFSDIARQFAMLEEHTRDAKTGLLYHEWNEPHTEAWVNKQTGTSASFWGRGTGWYLMALVDALPYYRQDDPNRAILLSIFQQTAAAVVRYQEPQSGLWYQVLDKPGQKGNYLESSAAGMFTYAFAKGVRLGYLPPQYAGNAQRAWVGMVQRFVKLDADGAVTISDTVKGIELGSAPSHDGSFEYYTTAPVVDNDPKGVGAFLLASSEMERQ